MRATHVHMHMLNKYVHTRAHARLPWTEFFVTALALYSSVKQYQSKLIMSDGPLLSQEQRTSG